MQDQRTRLLQVGGHYRGKPPLWATVDAEDFDWLSQWSWSFGGRYIYRPVNVGGKRTTLLLHRAILGLEHGDPLQGDHINRDRFDNRRSNLRVATNAQNSQNVPGRVGASRHRGVTRDNRRDKWVAQVQVRGKRHHLGQFDTEDEAAAVALAARREHFAYAID